jgi:hypothetical protein
MSELPLERERLVDQIKVSGSMERDASRAKLDALLVQDLEAAFGHVSNELLETRKQMAASTKATSHNSARWWPWTAVLSFATLAYAVAAFLPSFRPSTSNERAWVLWVTSGRGGPDMTAPEQGFPRS